jgi:hypothetical protein
MGHRAPDAKAAWLTRRRADPRGGPASAEKPRARAKYGHKTAVQ